MATKKQATGTVKARVLVACSHGNVDDVVEIPAEVAEAAAASGEVDTAPEAVAYAESAKAE